MSVETAKDNRAMRRREVAREMRMLIERTAKLGASNDESCPTGKAHCCVVCAALFECVAGCVAGDARAFLRKHKVDGSDG